MTTSASSLDQKSLEQALAESDDRYQKLLTATSDYVFSVDLNHGVTRTTHGPGCEAITGYTPADYNQDRYLWYRVIHDDDRLTVLSQIDLILHNKIPATPLEHRIIHKDGSVRWIRNTTLPRHNEQGQLLGYDGLISDITERKTIELNLRETNLFLDSVVENIPIGIFVKNATDLRFSHVNRFEETLLGWSRDQMVGRNDYDFFPREEADFFTAKDREVLGSGNLLDIPEEPIRLKDGTIRILHTKKIPVQDENGRARYLLGISEDITDRKRAEDAPRESEARVRLATDAAGIAVWDWNVKTNAIQWDVKMFELYGLPPTPGGWVTYQDWADRVLPSELAEQAAQLQRTATTGGQSQREFHIIRASDHATRVIQAAEMALAGSDGQTVRVVGMNIDITEHKEAEMRLQKANAKLIERGKVLNQLVRNLQTSHRELKEAQLQLIQSAKLESLGTLAAGVAHEVKNPLQTILLGLNYLSHRLTPADDNLAMTLNDMRDAVNRANNIILELLSLSANSDYHIAPSAPNDLIERALLLTGNLLTNSQITLQRELSPDLPRVPVDPHKLEQVLINIIINGIQAMAKGGTLTVRSRMLRVDETSGGESVFRKFKPGETLVVIEVQDTGHGLTEIQLLKVFDPFFTTKPVGLGTGLGLSVTKKIVDEHGGNIEIKNAPGGGALVAVVLKT